MQRMRRLRVNENMRSLVRETSVEISDLVYPIFVEEGENIAEPIPSMPNIKDTVLIELMKNLTE